MKRSACHDLEAMGSNPGQVELVCIELLSRTLTGGNPYKCNICEKSFVQSSDLKRHSQIFLVQVRLRTEVPRTPSSTRPGFELMTVK